MINSMTFKREDFLEVFNSLYHAGELIRLDDEIFILKGLYDKSQDILKDYIRKNGSITVAEFRDLLDTNRKITLALLESFDQQGLTRRVEDKRFWQIFRA